MLMDTNTWPDCGGVCVALIVMLMRMRLKNETLLNALASVDFSGEEKTEEDL